MKRLIYLALTVLMISGLSACNSYNYYTAAINKTNLSSYHTFAWMPPAGKSDKQMVNNQADAKIKALELETQALRFSLDWESRMRAEE